MKPIYLDYNATTPIAPEAADAMMPFLREDFGNPSSSHSFGVRAKQAIEKARQQVAGLIACQAVEVIFTSGGTESNNHAIRGAALARKEQGSHIITSAVEHPAVMEVCRFLEKQGYRLSILPVDGRGLVDPDDLQGAIDDETILVSVMHANNEVGTIQPIRELAAIAHQHGALFHTDAAQSVGKIAVDVNELGVDLLSIAGHKLYAPKGIGALFVRSGVKLEKLMQGADHELNRRPGTENVLEIVGLGAAAELARRNLDTYQQHTRDMRDHLHAGLKAVLDGERMRLNGDLEKALPNTLSVSFRGVEASTLLAEIGERVAASAGAACHADKVEVSSVLEAMHVPVEWAMGTVRFSVGRGTTRQQVDEAVEIVKDAVQRLLPAETARVAETDEMEEIKLTRFTHGLGCACKLRPQALEEVLQKLPAVKDEAVLVGTETADDASVYRIDADTAVVQTVDFFTPIVDDPYWFGAISAANSISDIYAMGGRPLFALNIVGFPTSRLPLRVLETILRGAQEKAAEAGVVIIGGHTVDDTEPKFGLAVTGIIDPDRVVRNSTAGEGDVLVLTKPIGYGIVSTAAKRGLAEPEEIAEATGWMATLNRGACEAMQKIGAHACTDITGFGLLGHLHEMMAGSGMDAQIHASRVGILKSARRLAAAGVIPGGTRDNLAYVRPNLSVEDGVSETDMLLLADAQTSGGLLICLPPTRLELLLKELEQAGVTHAAVIGSVSGRGSGHIRVMP